MSEEEIKRIRENYILAYRSNYDSARELHNKVFDTLEQLKTKNKELSLLLIEFQQMEYERNLYKSVIDEVREEVESNISCTSYLKRDLLEILDKANKESE